MKRDNKTNHGENKLVLSKQTIRELKPGELEQSAGGAFEIAPVTVLCETKC